MPRELGYELQPLELVRRTVLSHIKAVDTETCRLQDAFARVLRENLVAREMVPSFDSSAMDGFAVRVSDLEGASRERPVCLPIQAETPAGDPGQTPLMAAKTIRIMTGAPFPRGADGVVPQELTQFDAREARFFQEATAGQHVRRAGGDLTPGTVALSAGVVLRGPQLAIAASLGYAEVKLTRRLRAGILSPGNELVEVGAPCGPGKIRNSNAFSLRGALLDAGVEPGNLGIVPDTDKDVLEAIRRAFDGGADLVVSTGGASAGDFDFVKKVVREHARPGYAFKVAMRPGKPQVFGLFDGKPVFGLPGNPAAAIISFEIFVRPALRRMRGEATVLEPLFGVRFPFAYRYPPGRVFLLRARVVPEEDGAMSGFRVVVPGEQDSGFLASMASANALVMLPAERSQIQAGEVLPALWLGGRP